MTIPQDRRQAMIAEELERSKKVLKHYSKGMPNGMDYLYPAVLERFVEDCFDEHVDLIEKWDGWRWHTAIDVISPLSSQQVEQAWNDAQAGKKLTKVEIAAGKQQAAVAAAVWPRPKAVHRMWRYRTLEADTGEYAGDDYVDVSSIPLVQIPITENTPACPEGTCADCDRLRAAGHKAIETLIEEWIEGYTKEAPSYAAKVREGAVVTSAVRKALSKESAKLTPEALAVWDRFFERLGQLWAAQKTWRLTMSCAPSTFLKLGHFGENSCYGCTGGSGHDKVVIGVVPRSVVLLMYNGDQGAAEQDLTLPDAGRPIKGSVSGRAWGWIIDTPKAAGVAFQNCYNVYWEQAEKPLLGAVAEYFNCADTKGLVLAKSTMNWCVGYGTYSNNDARVVLVRGTLAAMHAGFADVLTRRNDYDRFKRWGREGVQNPRTLVRAKPAVQHECSWCGDVHNEEEMVMANHGRYYCNDGCMDEYIADRDGAGAANNG